MAKIMYIRNIELENVKLGMRLAESVYTITDTNNSMLVARKGYEVDDKILRVLERFGVETIPVWSRTKPEEENEPQAEKPAPKLEKRVWVKGVLSEDLKKEALGSIKQLFSILDPQRTTNMTTAYQSVRNLDSVMGDLLRAVAHDERGLIHISDLKHYDEYTYHHSLSVSLLSISTGKELGLDSEDLLRLGRCAMLHDIGKQAIPLEILHKKGRLDKDEFDSIKRHSAMGALNLKANAVGDVELWNSIMFHHEKINGKGYPKGLEGDEIPLFSKIISVADVYDAITSYRPYRSPMLPANAVDHIYQDAGVAFDHNVVNAFFEKLEFYPVNTIVELSDERLGIVSKSELENRLRPAIRIWGTDEIIHLSTPEHTHLQITDILSHTNLPPGYEFVDKD